MADYTLAEAMKTQRALRDAAGLHEETFPVDRFIGMISDEIEALRNGGASDDEIANLISKASGKPMGKAELTEHFVPADRRHG